MTIGKQGIVDLTAIWKASVHSALAGLLNPYLTQIKNYVQPKVTYAATISDWTEVNEQGDLRASYILAIPGIANQVSSTTLKNFLLSIANPINLYHVQIVDAPHISADLSGTYTLLASGSVSVPFTGLITGGSVGTTGIVSISGIVAGVSLNYVAQNGNKYPLSNNQQEYFPFAVTDMTANYEAIFTTPGTYTYTIELYAEDGTTLLDSYSDSVTINAYTAPEISATLTGTYSLLDSGSVEVTFSGLLTGNGAEGKSGYMYITGLTAGATLYYVAQNGTEYLISTPKQEEFKIPASDSSNYKVVFTGTGTYYYEFGLYDENDLLLNIYSDSVTINAYVVPTTPPASTPSSNGGGGGGSISKDSCPNGDNSGSYYDGTCGDTTTENEVVLSGEVEEDDETTADTSSAEKSELELAYDYAFSKGITTMDTIEKARLNDKITRAELAKVISQYAITVLGKTPDTSKDCSAFLPSIKKYQGQDLYDLMTTACQLNLMGIHPDQSPLSDFMPDAYVSRAEF